MVSNIKKVFAVWFCILWSVCVWLIYENLYPHQTYGVPQINYLMMVVESFVLFFVAGVPLFLFFRYREVGIKGAIFLGLIFVVASVSLFVSMVPLFRVSELNKGMVQMYVNDLENEGFDVEYSEYFPYGHWPVHDVDSFSEFIQIVKEDTCETVIVNGGVPSYFMFYVPPHVQLTAWGQDTTCLVTTGERKCAPVTNY